MRPRQSYIGQRYNRLVVKADAEDIIQKTGKPTRQLLCECDCGTEFIARANDVRTGNTKSCGCLYREVVGKCNIKHGMSISVDRGGAATTEYQIWRGMIQRCTNPSQNNYYLYGARGIMVCDRWLTFENFFADMGLRPSKNHSVDRINGDGNYTPDNCRWATSKEQFANARISPEFIAHMGRGNG